MKSHEMREQHHYGTNFAQFQAYVQDANNRFPGKQIVVTEFALQNPAGGQADQCVLFSLFPFIFSIN